MSRITSFQLSEELDDFIREYVQRGRFASASEVVRVALERLREEEEKGAWLMRALHEAEQSGIAGTHDEVWARFYARHPELQRR